MIIRRFYERPVFRPNRCHTTKNTLPFPRALITMKCYTDWSLYNRLSAVTMTYRFKKILPPLHSSNEFDNTKGDVKRLYRSTSTGQVKKIRDLRDTKIGCRDHLGRIISSKYRWVSTVLWCSYKMLT